jgi:metal transporter CNNM
VVTHTLSCMHREILPSAIFTGPNQLRIAAAMTYFVWVLMTVLSPIAWPIAKVLDRLVGVEVSWYTTCIL